ncbi:hypothetical protein NKR23_g9434 [Pleurostoma richardsiae]|uniref:Uncharacterized protein n=1 Tax=Pleurostoma richardsiae TaxID=41990 RepID=A0AA38VK60_9PEZI|nr:hypothetical protein NKR23_g9434 [Pleurostoma richardsiae]
MHEMIRQDCLPGDSLTPKLLELVEESMLLEEPKDRKSARVLHEKFVKILGTFEQESGLSSSMLSPLPNEVDRSSTLNRSNEETLQPQSPGPAASKMGRFKDGLKRGVGQAAASIAALRNSPTTPELPPRRPVLAPIQGHGEPRSMSDPTPENAMNVPSPTISGPAFPHRHSLVVPGLGIRSPSATSSVASFESHLVPSLDNLYLSLAEAREWKMGKKAYDLTKARDSNKIISSLQAELVRREHIFLVETSIKMKAHAARVLEAFDTLAYIAKKDKNKVQLAFTSTLEEKIHGSTEISPLMKVLQECGYDQLGCFMEEKLTWLVDNILIERLVPETLPPSTSRRRPSDARPLQNHPISLIVFTDGRWGDDTDGAVGVQNAIQRLIDCVKQHNLPRTRIMIQFIQFGDDEIGKRHLKYLVDYAKSQNCDIVDTTSIDGNICSMMIGSINHKHGSEEVESPNNGLPRSFAESEGVVTNGDGLS